ncbi:MAG: bifunctional phosphopantothenoylcysteine decarboxylase/phosphopantothenate--cysteine ligase CoaBC [Candidatus Bipolaricaulota bacterium]|nr:bifunctional phosphopantothenoylcysteine decarboxylase/phosphopantothenate--cysteine ligase CoaBC [Candidatus Bipolaricaulota bacterium]
MSQRNVVLGVTGSIAAYKAADLASRLTQAGLSVHTVMTENATKLVGPATFRALTGRPVATEMFDLTNPFSIEHVSLADLADVFVVAPATANVIAKLAHGIADDLLTCTALATRAPLLVAPAMHTAMWENPATQANVETLRTRGVRFVGPTVGRLASGGHGAGRMAPVDDIADEIGAILGRNGDLTGRRILVTAGGTREAIDPVRFLGNPSSGKMGYAVAAAARDRGAAVTLVSGPTSLRRPAGVRVVDVVSADEMLEAVRGALPGQDVLVMAAAVADFAPKTTLSHKAKKGDAALKLDLRRTADILETVRPIPVKVKVGFAAETENLVENARDKLERKGLDFVVANDVGGTGCPFGSDENEAILVNADDAMSTPRLSKRALADLVLDRVVTLLESA